jgi:hypothetical protein
MVSLLVGEAAHAATATAIIAARISPAFNDPTAICASVSASPMSRSLGALAARACEPLHPRK